MFKHFWRFVAQFTQDWFSSPIVWLQFLGEVSWGEHRLKGWAWSQGSSRSRADVKRRPGSGAGSCQLNLLEQPWNRNKPWWKQLNSSFFFFFNLSSFSDCFKKLFPAHSITKCEVYSRMTHSVTKGEGMICHMCQKRPMRSFSFSQHMKTIISSHNENTRM